MFTALAVRDVQAQAVTHQPACEEYALNLPGIEEYIGHSIPVSKYNSDALLTELPPPKRLTRNRSGNGQRRGGNNTGRRGAPRHSNRKRSG